MTIQHFENLPEEKREVILSSSFYLFGKNGYKKTSIADIAKQSGVSKAAIFHYFGSKNDLYLYLCNHAFEQVLVQTQQEAIDFFDYVSLFVKNRMIIEDRYPGIFEFLQTMCQQSNRELIEGFDQAWINRAERANSLLLDQVNWTPFKEEYDQETVTNMTVWLTSGCIDQLSGTMSRQEIYQELEKYLGILKQQFYKAEFL